MNSENDLKDIPIPQTLVHQNTDIEPPLYDDKHVKAAIKIQRTWRRYIVIIIYSEFMKWELFLKNYFLK